MSIGLIFFTLADVQVQPNFHLFGVVLISGALCADAVIGNMQEKQMKLHKASNIEVVSYIIYDFFIYHIEKTDNTYKIFNFFIRSSDEPKSSNIRRIIR